MERRPDDMTDETRIDVVAETLPDSEGYSGRVAIMFRRDDGGEMDLTLPLDQARRLWGLLGDEIKLIDNA